MSCEVKRNELLKSSRVKLVVISDVSSERSSSVVAALTRCWLGEGKPLDC